MAKRINIAGARERGRGREKNVYTHFYIWQGTTEKTNTRRK